MSIVLTYNIALEQKDELLEIINGCKKGERQAQTKLYYHFYPTMMAMVRRYFSNNDECEEILNNGMLRVFEKIDQFQGTGAFEGWVRKIVFHSVSNYVKANVRYKSNVLLDDKEYFISTHDADRLQYEDIMKLIHELPTNSRAVFNMYVIDGYAHKDIAKILNMSEGTSKWYLCEARKILKEKINQKKLA